MLVLLLKPFLLFGLLLLGWYIRRTFYRYVAEGWVKTGAVLLLRYANRWRIWFFTRLFLWLFFFAALYFVEWAVGYTDSRLDASPALDMTPLRWALLVIGFALVGVFFCIWGRGINLTEQRERSASNRSVEPWTPNSSGRWSRYREL